MVPVHELRLAARAQVIAHEALAARWHNGPLMPWGAALADQVAVALSAERHGDLPRWQAALAALPELTAASVDLEAPAITLRGSCSDAQRHALEAALRGLHPWRKGPFSLFGVEIDTEWRSDWKWDRVAKYIQPLQGRRVLDVGCGSGYHLWRMRGAGAAEAIGIEPSLLYVMQFLAVQRYLSDPMAQVIPVTLEQLPSGMKAFDTVFSMGVLYHRRSPFGHLARLRDCLREGGELVLETLVVDGDTHTVLVPPGRYASMRNVWFLPSPAALASWLEKTGWRNVRVVDVNITALDEQRRTDWMQFHSLANFLHPDDRSKTVEGHPAPQRAVVVATA